MRSIAASKPDLSSTECLSHLVENLRNMSYSLGTLYQDDVAMRDKIFRACNSFPACQEAVVRPAFTLANVISDLQTSTT